MFTKGGVEVGAACNVESKDEVDIKITVREFEVFFVDAGFVWSNEDTNVIAV